MRKNTEECLLHFTRGHTYRADRDFIHVSIFPAGYYEAEWKLHDNTIAKLRFTRQDDGITPLSLTLYDAGWQTRTTLDRLNAILCHYSLPRLRQRNFVWLLGDESWAGCKDFAF